jgi:TPR repeat protein
MRPRSSVLHVVVLVLGLSACSRSPEVAFNKGQYLEAADLWLQQAENGNPDALCRCMAALNILGKNPKKAKHLAERLSNLAEASDKRIRNSRENREVELAKLFSCFQTYFRKAADAGNANAQYLLADWYRGQEGKSAEIERLFELAAKNGDPRAQYQMGVKHFNDTDKSTVLRWWKLSSAKEYFPATQNLAIMYRDGDGVAQDFELAAKLFLKGAQQGFASAQMDIGNMYARGQGVPQDFVQAHFWFNVAGFKAMTEQERKQANEARDLIAQNMTHEQVAEAQSLAREWRPKEADY